MQFVIQEFFPPGKPDQRRYYLRLEKDKVFLGWAVPKGIPDQPGVKRLAVPVGDYRLDQAEFEGRVAGGRYGPGKISVLDRGEYLPFKWTDREIQVCLRGKKAIGLYTLKLVEFKESGDKSWLLEKQKEKAASQPVTRRVKGSVKTTSPADRPAPKRSRKPPRKKTAPARKRSSSKTPAREKKKGTILTPPSPPAVNKPAKSTPRPAKSGKERKFKPLGRTFRQGKKKSRGFTTSSSIVRGLFGMWR